MRSSAAAGAAIVAGLPRSDGADEADPKRIMVGYVWSLSSTPHGNIGDYSITPGLVTLLNRHFPTHRVTAIDQRRTGPAADRVENNLQRFPECSARFPTA